MKYKKKFYLLTLILSILTKLRLFKGRKVVNRFGFKLILDLDLPGISRAIFCEGYREIDHTNIFSEKLISKKKILDLGSNIGYYALEEASDSNQNSKIVCIEPDQRNLFLLNENIKINKLESRIEVLNCAVSDKDGYVKINTNGPSNLSKIEENFNYDNNFQTVKSISLNSLYKKYGPFDCLRMDVEGAESVILSNNSDIFLKNMPINSLIFMEIHPGNYIRGNSSMISALENLKSSEFTKYQFVTSGKKPDDMILNRLEKSKVFFIEGKFKRYYYQNISFEDLKFFALHIPKIIRYIIAEK